MATRSIIKVIYGQTNITFYRHWDGYLAEGGYDLACILKHSKTAESFIKQLIMQNRGLREYEVNTPLYEIVNCDNVGEEFRYTFKFTSDSTEVRLTVEQLTGWSENKWTTLFEEVGEIQVVAEHFLQTCKKDQAEIEKRVKNRIQQGEMVSLY